jgi:hypothetical protein
MWQVFSIAFKLKLEGKKNLKMQSPMRARAKTKTGDQLIFHFCSIEFDPSYFGL